MWRWRRAMGGAGVDAEHDAFEEHLGQKLSEHQCSWSDEQHAEYQKWQETYERPLITITMEDAEQPSAAVQLALAAARAAQDAAGVLREAEDAIEITDELIQACMAASAAWEKTGARLIKKRACTLPQDGRNEAPVGDLAISRQSSTGGAHDDHQANPGGHDQGGHPLHGIRRLRQGVLD